ncbi:MAG TPA: DUF61 family protein [Methanothermococcus okinawensis]|uniref:UPF0216 protein EYH15_05765 n=1 Tax=Methanothermococcus okinawensis TaxID=155863 RepID=A0A832ZEA2_9EURY|nr:DUF61 family protein [Methanococcaceae archaeon]HIP84978.1 DUF61 family protein [Methanothermococcus okinawensis]HIP91259.1 DUF61 family protein [Methanothermococcus okinawensis]
MDREIYRFLCDLNVSFKRKTLRELLKEEKPYVIINGRRHRIKKRELRLLRELTDNLDLKIPIVLEIDASLESGTVKISGPEEVKVISKILGREINPFSKEDTLYIYKPEVRIVRRHLPTTTVYLFKMGVDIE